jgi:hypothetical protein
MVETDALLEIVPVVKGDKKVPAILGRERYTANIMECSGATSFSITVDRRSP